MRNMHYKAYSFRLSEKTIISLKNSKILSGLSYNLLFVKMLRKIKLKDK